MTPVINPLYPVEDIASVDQLMAIAVGMEREAAERYEQLAAWMEAQGDGEMRDLFRRMAGLERDHEAGLSRWAVREGRAPPLPAVFSWRLPETFDQGEAAGLSPYRALGIAVRNEERAFAFYTYLAAMAPGGEVRARAEALAREELNHVAELRILRRRAFHRHRPPPAQARRAASLGELREIALGLERGSRDIAEAAAATLVRAGDGEAATLLLRSAPAVDGQGGTGSEAAEGARSAGLLRPDALSPGGALALALRDADQVAETCMAIAEHADDEAVLRQAQALAERAVGRAALLRTVSAQRSGRRGSTSR